MESLKNLKIKIEFFIFYSLVSDPDCIWGRVRIRVISMAGSGSQTKNDLVVTSRIVDPDPG